MSRTGAASPARPSGQVIEHPVLDRIGGTPLVQLAGASRRGGLDRARQARIGEPRGQRQGPGLRGASFSTPCVRGLLPQTAPARLDQRQYRHRLRHARRGPGLRGHPVPARQRQHRAQAHPARLRGGGHRDRRPGGLGRRPGPRPSNSRPPIPITSPTSTSTPTPPTRAPTSLSTGPEIIEQRAGRALDLFVAGLGTSVPPSLAILRLPGPGQPAHGARGGGAGRRHARHRGTQAHGLGGGAAHLRAAIRPPPPGRDHRGGARTWRAVSRAKRGSWWACRRGRRWWERCRVAEETGGVHRRGRLPGRRRALPLRPLLGRGRLRGTACASTP